MEENNVFVYAVLSNQQHVLRRTGAMIGINVSGRAVDSVIGDIIPDPAVSIAAISTGRLDIILSTRFANMNKLVCFICDTLPLIKGVNTIETHLYSAVAKYYGLRWPMPELASPTATPCHGLPFGSA